jgi:hypothetical protein
MRGASPATQPVPGTKYQVPGTRYQVPPFGLRSLPADHHRHHLVEPPD